MSTSADITNAVLHRKGVTSSTEALHSINSAAAAQRRSISNLHEQGHYGQNQTDRRSISSMHRSGGRESISSTINQQCEMHGSTDRRGQKWASTTYQVVERPQKIVRRDNLSVGGDFFGHSEARSYGNFTKNQQQTVSHGERIVRKSNTSHISLGDSSLSSATSYKREYVPLHTGPCPATLLESNKAPYKHTRDTKTHKFYLPSVTGN